MYPWATKEYLLWNMTIGQISMYYSVGMDIKSGKQKKASILGNKSAKELRELRDSIISDAEGLDRMRQKYGAIDD